MLEMIALQGIEVENWLNTPLIVIAAIAVGSLIFYGGKWYQAVNSDRESFKIFMGRVDEALISINDKLHNINDKLHNVFSRLPAAPISSNSPIGLTELGREISEELDGKQWARDSSKTLIDKCRPLTPYEIQERCFKRAKRESQLTDEMKVRVMDSAYKHGLTKDKVLDVLGIELRDHILAGLGRMDALP